MIERTATAAAGGNARAVQLGDATLPDESDVVLASHAIRTHCAMPWPEGVQCNNCQAPFPCMPHRWAQMLLRRAGWTEDEISALDRRVGPWA